MSFHDVRFPTRLTRGSTGGPQRRTEIVTLNNGWEARNAAWADSRRVYDAGLGVQSADDLAEVLAFFEARRGRLHGFRWKDWLDSTSALPSANVAPTDQVLGLGTGIEKNFPLRKAYQSGEHIYHRSIALPLEGTVRVSVDGVEIAEGAGWTLVEGAEIEPAAGGPLPGKVVVFDSAPAIGVTVAAGYEFDVPVRFAEDEITVSLTAMEAGEIPSIPVVEVRL